jgi:hypothetical protein
VRVAPTNGVLGDDFPRDFGEITVMTGRNTLHQPANDGRIGRRPKERLMSFKLEDWEATVEKIVDETTRSTTQSGMRRVLDDWRTKLEREPSSLQAFQIDLIVREVRRRLKDNEK